MLNVVKVKDGIVKVENQEPLMKLRQDLGGLSDKELEKLTQLELADLLEMASGGNYVAKIGR